ncbi:MAG: hypothetical protein WD794_15660 [Mycobacteriales bacterium]
MIVSSYHHLVAPLVAAGALAVILLLCRWVFSTADRDRRNARRAAAPPAARGGDYGLLVPVATVRTADDAEMLRAVLREAGIRCTVAADADGADVLVFRTDVLRARELVAS